jgi:hypothetical protein
MIRLVYLILFIETIVSCKKEAIIIEEPWECLPFSHYSGPPSGTLQIGLTGTDTSFTNIPIIIELV